jgi:FHA domain/zinc-ribbon domain
VTRMCPSCGQEVADLARFCSNCGTALVDLSEGTPGGATGTMDLPVTSTGPLGSAESAPLGAVAPGKAMLIVRSGPSEGTSFLLTADTTSIGRADSADVLLDDVTVSRRHAEVIRSPQGWVLRDSGSLNGTYVNRTLIDQVVLQGGDEVQIGKYRFVFLVGGGQG